MEKGFEKGKCGAICWYGNMTPNTMVEIKGEDCSGGSMCPQIFGRRMGGFRLCQPSSRVVPGLGWVIVSLQPVLGVQRSHAVVMGTVTGRAPARAVGAVTASPAMGALPVPSVGTVTMKPLATPATWYVRVGSGSGRGRPLG